MPEYLYVIRTPTGLRKVGHSTSPLARSRQLEQINAIRERGTFTVEYQRECPDPPEAVEKHAHALLAPTCVKREYFNVSLEIATAAVDAAIETALAGEMLLKPPRTGKFLRLEMRVSKDWLRKLDDIRRDLPGVPSRAEALRILTIRALDAAEAKSRDPA